MSGQRFRQAWSLFTAVLALLFPSLRWLLIVTGLLWLLPESTITRLNNGFFKFKTRVHRIVDPILLTGVYVLAVLPLKLIRRKRRANDGQWVAKADDCRFDRTI